MSIEYKVVSLSNIDSSQQETLKTCKTETEAKNFIEKLRHDESYKSPLAVKITSGDKNYELIIYIDYEDPYKFVCETSIRPWAT
jgi:hypothetical protein